MLNNFHVCSLAGFCLSHSQLSLQWIFKSSFFSASLTGLLTSPFFQRLFLKPCPASAHSPLVLPIHFQDNGLRYECVCSLLYTWGLQLVCSEEPCWHAPLCRGQNQLEQELLCSPGSDSVCLNHCWRQMSLTLGMSPASLIRPEEFTGWCWGGHFAQG